MGAGTGVGFAYLPNKKIFFSETTDAVLHYCCLLTIIGCRYLTDRLEVYIMSKAKPAPKQAPKAAPKGGKKK